MNDLFKKINLASLVAALGCFFLPWLDLQCQGRTLMTQTGFQTVTGSMSVTEDFKDLSKSDKGAPGAKADDKSPGTAYLVAAAVAVVLIALVLAALDLKKPTPTPGDRVGQLAGLALVLILIQLAVGFPMKRGLHDALMKDTAKPGAGPASGPDAELDRSMSLAMAASFQVNTEAGLYLELLALAIPLGLYVRQIVNRRPPGAAVSAPPPLP